MKKILWITYDFSTDLGGKGLIMKSIIKDCADDFQIEILDLEIGKTEPFAIDLSFAGAHAHNVSVHAVACTSTIDAVQKAIKLCRGKQADTIVIGASPSIDLLILAAMHLKHVHRDTPVIRIEYTNPKIFLGKSRFAALYQFLAKTYFKKVDMNIVPTDSGYNLFRNEYGVPENRVQKIFWPTVPENVAELAQQAVGSDIFNHIKAGGAPTIITVMRLSRDDKDFDTLLRAFAIVLDTAKKKGTANERLPHLFILGNGDPAVVTGLIVELNIGDFVHLLGYEANTFSYLSKSDVFAFASTFEGSPRVIVEALAAGCPPVATDCNYGPREVINDGVNGFLVPVKDPVKLAEKVITLLDDQALRNSMASRGPSSVKEHGEAAIGQTYKNLFRTPR